MTFDTNNKITNELIRLNKENGGILTPSQVVAAAKNPRSPLHGNFDWNDTAAAKKWRLHQARNMLRVCVWYDDTDQIKEPVKVFVSLTTDRKENEGYRVITDVLSDEEAREQMFADALAELVRFRKKYAILQELGKIFEEIENIKKKSRKIAVKVK